MQGRARTIGPALPQRPASATDTAITRLVAAVTKSEEALSAHERGNFVGSELPAVHRALSRLDADDLARGRVFCEWGSGLGGVCGVAAINGFTPSGIETSGPLVESARLLAVDRELAMTFARGTFLLPGDEDLAARAHSETRLDFDAGAWDEIELAPGDCDVVFAYPWPGEEGFVDGVFARHASDAALLVTFHDFDRVLVQRKRALQGDLLPIGWM
jgi:hypothetical protein